MNSPKRRAFVASVAALVTGAATTTRASNDGSRFEWLRLRDVDARAGGIEIWLSGSGTILGREIGPAGPDRSELRWTGAVGRSTLDAITRALPAFVASAEGFGRSGVPGEPYLQIDLERAGAVRLWRGKFRADRRPEIDAIEQALRDAVTEARNRIKPLRVPYDANWRP
ncbi:MAG: hypothetical protein KIT73_18730 [Burkholderiales bacterium]|nr:hypothetical protein [Burkholderiales bacterium]